MKLQSKFGISKGPVFHRQKQSSRVLLLLFFLTKGKPWWLKNYRRKLRN